ncbi:MAG: hypothetical protein AUI14_14230 [Actinobacteria bacterium 13_2_20CM_2_71_6]|nr:MAG: hypothetical protein AUI14_14230 [Actinobacteria bacterium 13_2_20CM_2_71_6]
MPPKRAGASAPDRHGGAPARHSTPERPQWTPWNAGTGGCCGRDLAAGRALAGPVALALAAGLSGFLWLTLEPLPEGHPGRAYLTLGPVAYAAWLLAIAGWVALPARYARVPVALAVAVSASVIPLAALTGETRPPGWVVLALLSFGALGLLAPPPGTAAARAGVAAGALVTAAVAKALLAGELPRTAWTTGYYTPAIALSGFVVTAAVLAVAAGGVLALLQGRPARPWLWAALLLALPGGWLGPRRAIADVGTSVGFGRLAEVLLATCVVLAAMAALSGVRREAVALHRAGAVALGFAAGLAAFLWVVGEGHLVPGYGWGRTRGPWAYAAWVLVALAWPVLPVLARRIGIGAAVCVTGAVALTTPGRPAAVLATLALLGVVALLGPGGRIGYPWGVGVATVAACAVVGSYDNGWRVTGWHGFTHTAGLLVTLAIVPFAFAALAGVRSLRAGVHRPAAALAVLTGTGWIGALTLPRLPAWGPILVLVPLAPAGSSSPCSPTATAMRRPTRRGCAAGWSGRSCTTRPTRPTRRRPAGAAPGGPPRAGRPRSCRPGGGAGAPPTRCPPPFTGSRRRSASCSSCATAPNCPPPRSPRCSTSRRPRSST